MRYSQIFRQTFGFTTLILWAFGCSGPTRSPEADDEIRVQVVSYLQREYPTNEPLFLRILVTDSTGKVHWADPSDGLISRLSSPNIVVHKYSQSIGKGLGGRFDSLDGRQGSEVWLGTIRWLSEHEAKVTCGRHRAALDGFFFEVTVRSTSGGWEITKESYRAIE